MAKLMERFSNHLPAGNNTGKSDPKDRLNTRVLLDAYKDGREAAEMDITNTPTAQLAKILLAQELLGRTWEYHFI